MAAIHQQHLLFSHSDLRSILRNSLALGGSSDKCTSVYLYFVMGTAAEKVRIGHWMTCCVVSPFILSAAASTDKRGAWWIHRHHRHHQQNDN